MSITYQICILSNFIEAKFQKVLQNMRHINDLFLQIFQGKSSNVETFEKFISRVQILMSDNIEFHEVLWLSIRVY